MQQHRKGGKIKQHRKAGAVVVTVGSGSGALFPGTWEQWLQGEHSAVLAVLSPTPRLCHIKAIGLQCWGWAGLPGVGRNFLLEQRLPLLVCQCFPARCFLS